MLCPGAVSSPWCRGLQTLLCPSLNASDAVPLRNREDRRQHCYPWDCATAWGNRGFYLHTSHNAGFLGVRRTPWIPLQSFPSFGNLEKSKLERTSSFTIGNQKCAAIIFSPCFGSVGGLVEASTGLHEPQEASAKTGKETDVPVVPGSSAILRVVLLPSLLPCTPLRD